MENVITFSSILLFIFLMFLIYKLDSISLKNRIYPFIDSNEVGKSIRGDLFFKNKLLHKFENNDSKALIDSAEFADLFAVAL
ncbi:MAG: hypothetical protein RLZZ195_1040, partial [Pseudomonadota bacterium]